MPQLIPFYFINQISFSYLFLILLIYFLSIYILPNFILINKVRLALC